MNDQFRNYKVNESSIEIKQPPWSQEVQKLLHSKIHARHGKPTKPISSCKRLMNPVPNLQRPHSEIFSENSFPEVVYRLHVAPIYCTFESTRALFYGRPSSYCRAILDVTGQWTTLQYYSTHRKLFWYSSGKWHVYYSSGCTDCVSDWILPTDMRHLQLLEPSVEIIVVAMDIFLLFLRM